MHENKAYQGFEQGPIRPPSEAYSLLLRVTRNCPWNRCTFCPLYKEARFSIRPVEHVKRDIDAIHRQVERLRDLSPHQRRRAAAGIEPGELSAFHAAWFWYRAGGLKSVFIQDANSLIIKPADLIEILQHLKRRFPMVERITSYARSHTIARITDQDLRAIKEAGLTRLHIGLESGSERVLKMVKKGATKETHLQAGLKVKNAGMELSEYYMPGLGGRALWEEHALETADALNRINPDFIRIRTLAIPEGAPLFQDYQAGRFEKCSDYLVAHELLRFVENLNGITSVVQSDHIVNLFEELEGTLPADQERLLAILHRFFALEPEHQRLYQLGRRLGIFSRLCDLDHPQKLAKARARYHELGITADNIDAITSDLAKRYI